MQSRKLNLEAGYLCLDFANTADWHASEHPVETLNQYDDLVTWAKKVGLFTETEARQLLQRASQHPDQMRAILAQAIALREVIYRIFSTINDARRPDTADLAALNLSLPSALSQLKVVEVENEFVWSWVQTSEALEQMLWPVVQSAADLLTSGNLNRVKECEDDRGCGFLFFDTSRNHSRRWCDMRGCGNRAKVRRYRNRQE